MVVVLDANCFIYAIDPGSAHYPALTKLLSESRSGRVSIRVSRHTLEELSEKPDAALALAMEFEPLPYWPIGTIKELVGEIQDLSGTWEDARRNEASQQEMHTLAKAGISIRDRGAYLDAVRSGADAFVTYDRSFVKEGKPQVEQTFGIPIVSAEVLLERLGL